ncbi:unnamed protein product [Oppiella nova]|uniref:Uncharacterized protein n=1 Tax=Oppiella nova TaxID=334625 RepID=A0A7R9MGZ0_9ACAR|nr:unnamed protein product [Oppiella nova]CAG2176215.1 unnamed protein product [Oppiella nova]
MKLLLFLVLIFSFDIYLTTSARTGIAIFNNTASGIQGALTMHRNPGLGTYLMGQLRNISCFNMTSATRTPSKAAVNNCMLGITVNNWRNAAQGERDALQSGALPRSLFNMTELESRQIFGINTSDIHLPNIREILSGGLNPIQNLFPSTTANNTNNNRSVNNTCPNVGDVYNPRRNMVGGPLGFLNPPGVMGNLLVNNGTGSLLMGPLEMLTGGPLNITGLPITVWMDSLRPQLTGNSLTLQNGGPDRILDCSLIQPLN